MPGLLRSSAARLARLLWPARCAACAAFVPEEVAFCDLCAVSATPLWAGCPGCAMPGDSSLCAGCRTRPFPFAGARSAFAYGGSVTQALLRLKHGGRRELAPILGRFLAGALDDASRAADLIVPVPLHRRRLRQRTFNQALELARAACPRRGPRVLPDALWRVRDTPPLGHATPDERRATVQDAFRLRPGARVQGRRALLIDDVLTTGATLAACARVLLGAGAAEVRVATVARTL